MAKRTRRESKPQGTTADLGPPSPNGRNAPDSPGGTPSGVVDRPAERQAAKLGRAITVEDLCRIKVVGEPAISPDGETVAFAVTEVDLDADGYRAAIWTVPFSGGEPRRLTAGVKRETTPRWSPDGTKITFLANRDTDAPQLWVIATGGGEARRLTNLPHGVDEPVWAPDSRRIAFVAEVDPPDPNPGSDVKVITEIRYKADGRGFLAGRRSHVFVVDVDREGAEPFQVTDGDFDHSSPAWSPTGRELAFAANRDPDWQLQRGRDVWTVVPGGRPRRLTDGQGAFDLPAWSPDGTRIAFVGHRKLRQEAANAEIWVVPAAGGVARSLTAGFDRGVGDLTITDHGQYPHRPPVWSADGASLTFLASDLGATHVFRVTVDGEVCPITTGHRRVAAFDVAAGSAGESFAFAASDPSTPFELYVRDLAGQERPLTTLNAAWMDEVATATAEPFTVSSHDGLEVHGWIMRPPGTTAGVAHPAILEIHGGPHGMYGATFFHEFQVLAARGYVVVFANPRGSIGYGEAFAEGLRAGWGEKDTPDLLACLDHAIAAGGIDPDRIGVTGGSYGGFMTNWLIGHTDRFRAAVTQRSLSNLFSCYGTDDIGPVSLDVEFGRPWQHRDRYLDLSPISYVEQMKAPLLILHSEQDYRCPIEQAEQLFVALKRLGREVVFVRFPDESHGLSRSGKPKHRLERLRRIVGWFDDHL
jgi:dipeptidyl aminopeptidase/acylaminoacyl peptidase